MTPHANPYYEPISDNELLAPRAVLALDADRYVDCLVYDEIINKIVSADDGLYLPWSTKPFLPAGVYYPVGRVGDPSVAIETYEQLLETTTPVVHVSDLKRVISDKVIKKYKRILSPKPTSNTPAIKLVCGYAVQVISNLAPVNRYHTARFPSMDVCLEDEYRTIEIFDAIECALDGLYLSIEAFIGKDTWHLYDIKLVGTSVIIEKLIDYRVFDWYRIQRDQHGENDD